jgi:NitT/TauT family transport system substrate-binding protein
VITFVVIAGAIIAGIFINNQNKEDIGEDYKTDTIVIATSVNQTKAILNIMQTDKLIEKYLPEGVSVEWANVSGFADTRDAIVSGQVNFASSGAPGVINAIEQGYPLRIVANSMSTSAKIYSNNPKIKSVKDLSEANRIAIQSLGGFYNLALNIISNENFNDYMSLESKLVELEYEDMLASLRTSSDIDAAIIAFPYTPEADNVEKLTMIYDATETIKENLLGNYLYTSTKFAEENPTLVKAFLKAEKEAVDYMNNDPRGAAQKLAKMYDDMEVDVLYDELIAFPPKMSITNYDKITELLFSVGILDKAPTSKYTETAY